MQPQPYGPPPGYQQPPPRKGTSPIVIILAVIGGMIVLGFGGCVVCVGAGAAGVAKQQAKEQEKKEQAKNDLVEVDAADLISAYKGNEVKADSNYKGKYVEVSGVVDKVGKDIADSAYVVVGSGKNFEHPQVQCTFKKKNGAQAGDLEAGQKVKVRGFVKGKMFNVLIEDCEVQ